jgi:chemotaxis protein methyltransferase CheR
MIQAARSVPASSASLVAGEFSLTAENFRRIAGFMRDQSGIHLPESKATLVYSRLAKRLRALGLSSFEEYCRLLASPVGAEERMAMLAALTTNVTRFFREPHHFDHLRAHFTRCLSQAARAGARVRIWSSACSTGEEPYSIALTVLSVLPDAAQLDVRVLATDIDPVVVAKAARGVYRADAIAPVPAALRERYFEKVADDASAVRVSEDARALVSFKELNLIAEWPMRGKFDVIFCRNVVIYFEEATQNRIWSRFKGALSANGRLYVGHSERVDAPGFVTDGLTVYRLAGGAS